ncbi:MAG: UDP-3-O-(3-hydroxymyristoyl)glucosamine N-acyltransferase [Planctomycetia bacterium]|nr:MAG: UDP-3-O-(3-hydroxymyristoyl)glucosamine N-acyltransferase [Planctomycetia bacterium]
MASAPSLSIAMSDLAARLGGRLEGDMTLQIRGVAALPDAGAGDISWVGDAKYEAAALRSRAAAFLAFEGVAVPPGRAVIRVADVDAALIEVLRLFSPLSDRPAAGVHPSAVVAPDAITDGVAILANVHVGRRARIGPGTVLHPGVYVGDEAVIGRDCMIWPNVVIRDRVTLGDRVEVHANSTIGADGFGYIYRRGRHLKFPHIGSVVIEDDVEIGANSTVDRAKTGVTRVGAGTKIDNLVQIAHNVRVGAGCVIVAQVGISGSCTLGNGVVLGGQAGVADHVRIGDGAMIAAQSGVRSEVPPGVRLAGTPAIDAAQNWRQLAQLRRLGDLTAELKDLRRRISELESAAHDPERR